MRTNTPNRDELDPVPLDSSDFPERFRARRTFLFGAAAAGMGAIALAATSAPSRAFASYTATHVIDVTASPYNATGNGTTDDTTAIQAAITAACGVTGGATVYFPSGEYLVSSTLTVNQSNITLRGEGPSSLIMFHNQSTGYVLEIASGSTTTLYGTTIQDLAIYSDTRMTAGAAIACKYVQDVRIVGVQCAARNVAIPADNLYGSLLFNNFSGVTIQSCMLTSNGIGLCASPTRTPTGSAHTCG